MATTKARGKAKEKSTTTCLYEDPFSFTKRTSYLTDVEPHTIHRRQLASKLELLRKDLAKSAQVDLQPDSMGNWDEYYRLTKSEIRAMIMAEKAIIEVLQTSNATSIEDFDLDLSFAGSKDNALKRGTALLVTTYGTAIGSDFYEKPSKPFSSVVPLLKDGLNPSIRKTLDIALDADTFRKQSEDFTEGESSSSSSSNSMSTGLIKTVFPSIGSKHIKGVFLIFDIEDFGLIYTGYVAPFINLTELIGIKDLVHRLVTIKWSLLTIGKQEYYMGYNSLNTSYPMITVCGRLMDENGEAIMIEMCLGVKSRIPRPGKVKDNYDMKIRKTTLSPFVEVVDANE
jgi:hypothetical protein